MWYKSIIFADIITIQNRKKKTHKCFILVKFANVLGIGPDIWFWSICILSKFER